MEEIALIQDFAVVLLVAGLVGWLFRKLGLSAVVGYLIAGFIIGPYTPPFTLVHDIGRIQTISNLGLIFLMFFVGLGLSLNRIKRLGFPILAATAFTAFFVFLLAQSFAAFMGWSGITALVFASMMMVSSSAIIVKILAEAGLTHERFAQNAQGITVLEDVVAVVMLTVIGSQLHTAGAGQRDLSHTLLLLLGFTVLVLVLGLILVPKLLGGLKRSSDADLKAVIVCGLVFAIGFLSVQAGFSLALGAFLFGVVIAETPFKAKIEKRLVGCQDMFSALFFVSIGMLIDVRSFAEHWPLILGAVGFALVARSLAASLGFLVAGNSLRVAAATGVTVTPIGEFSYIIAQTAVNAGAVPSSFYSLAVGASIATAMIAPFVTKRADRFGAWVEERQPALLRSLLEGYRYRLDGLSQKLSRNPVWKLTRHRLGMVMLEFLLLAGLLGFSQSLFDGLEGILQKAGYGFPGLQLAYWLTVAALAVTIIVALWRSLSALGMIYAEALTSRNDYTNIGRPIVQTGFQVLSAIGLAAVIWFVFPAETALPWASFVVLGGGLIFALTLWRQMIKWHSRFESSLAGAMDQGHGALGRVTELSQRDRTKDWNVDVSEVELPENAACVAQTVAQLDLRSRFGCIILEVERQGYVIGPVQPDFALFPGDRLLLFGKENQINLARDFLSQERPFTESESDFDAAVLETVTIPPNSLRVGKTLGDLRIYSETGVQVMGLAREGKYLLNPAAGEVLQSGDVLLLMATPTEVRAFQDWLEAEPYRA